MCKLRIFGLLRLFSLLCLFLSAATPKVVAQRCVSSADGSVFGMLGTDFDQISNGTYTSGAYSVDEAEVTSYYGVDLARDGEASRFTYERPTKIVDYKQNGNYISFTTNTSATYFITDSLHKWFPKGQSAALSNFADGTNSFLVTKGDNGHGTFCGIKLCPASQYSGRTVTFTFRVYVIKADATIEDCKWVLGEYLQPTIMIGCHGNTSGIYENMYVDITPDGYPTVSTQIVSGQGACIQNHYSPETSSSAGDTVTCTDQWGNSGTYVLPQVMVGYTIKYTFNVPNDYNTCYQFYPAIQVANFGNYYLAFDYINFGIEHICTDRDSICPGDPTVLTAVDYEDGVKLEWCYQLNGTSGTWIPFTTSTIDASKTNSVEFPSSLTKTLTKGTRVYFRTNKVEAEASDPMKYSIPVEVVVSDPSSCAPPDPELSVNNMCAPYESQSVSVSNATSTGSYTWQLLDPNGTDVSSKYLTFDESKDAHHTSATIKPDKTAVEGTYTLKVSGRHLTIVDATSGVVVKTFTVYQTPAYSQNIYDKNGYKVSDGGLCPADLKQHLYYSQLENFTATNSDYTYTWSSNVVAQSNPIKATLNLGDDTETKICAGLVTSVKVSATIDNHGCPQTSDKSITIESPSGPNIACDAWKSTVTLNLDAKADDMSYTVALPSVTSQCGENPVIDVTITDPKGNAIPFTYNADKTAVTATYPLGKSTITVTATDDCGNTADCSKTIEVKDVTPPNLDCSQIPNYTTYLSYYDACEATPGKGTHPEALPTLTAPKLEDLDHPGTFITGKFVSRSDLATSLTTAFKVGTTSIRWSFTDASNNTSYCTQTVTIINDRKPSMSCSMPTDQLVVSTDLGQCGAYSDSIVKRIDDLLGTTPMPSATNACEPLISLTPHLYYQLEGGDEIAMPASGFMFEADKNYTLIWRFYNNNGVSTEFIDGTAYDECKLDFIVRDKQAPVVSCTNTTPINVTVNVTRNGSWASYDTYASGRASSGTNSSYKTYTLAGKFDNIPTASDACSGILLPKVYIDKDNARTTVGDYTSYASADAAKEAIIEALEKTRFNANTTSYVSFVFTDDAGNKDSCVTQVSVVSQSTPIPNCWTTQSVELSADNKCQATTDLFAFDKIPTASFALSVIDSKTFTQKTLDYTLYPSKIVRQHYNVAKDGTETLESTLVCDNESAKETVDRGFLLSSVSLQTSNFADPGPECLNTSFALGKTVITLYYDNGDADEPDSSKCVATVVVKDVTAPSVDCGNFASADTKKVELPADKCELSFDELGFNTPTLDSLNASDNCTAKDDLTLTFSRTFKGKAVDDITSAYQIGTHTISWTVTDASGNSSVCTTKFEVVDVTGPSFDCSTLKPITGYADENCEVSYADLLKAGLLVPMTENDKCSPVGTAASIYAVGSRSDGKAMNDPYTKDASPITVTWTFTDAAGNTTVCTQDVIILDTIAPVFEDCDNLTDLVYYTEPGHCQVSSEQVKDDLGSHYATDNCGETVVGKPGVGIKGAEAIPDSFAVGTTVVTWVFTDASGNSSYCTQNVVVYDTISPRVGDICPSSVNADAPEGSCEIQSPYTDAVVFNDPCDGKLYGVFARDDDPDLSNIDPFPVGTTNVTWTFTDHSGNSSVCKATVTVKDITKPILYCNTTVNDSLIFSVSGDVCGVDPIDVVNAIQIPYAYDECEDRRIDDFTSKRWYKGLKGDETPVLETDASGKPVAWNNDAYIYKTGYTNIFFIFTDASGNADSCMLTVYVNERNIPKIDCDVAVPTPITLTPDMGVCDVKWADIDKSMLNPGDAYDVCHDEYIKGKPINADGGRLTDGEEGIPASIASGDSLRLQWYFISTAGNSVNCPQTIYVVDNQKPSIECDTIPNITVTADSGKCSADGAVVVDALKPYPVAKDNCGDIVGVPSRADGLAIDAPYPTGETKIIWTFSDSNPDNDVTCEKTVFVKGSVAPDIDCDTFKHYFDTIPECTTEPLSIRTPYAVDECAPESLKSVAGVPTRSDGAAFSDPYPLGNTVITWTFTDFTNNVSSSCTDTVNVRTLKKMNLNCTADIQVDAETGECTKSVSVKQPVADHPCLDVKIPGVPYIGSQKIEVKNGEIVYNFRTGVTKVMWIFTDTTNSLVKPVDTCYTNVQVGNTNEMPVDCSNFPEIRKTLVGKCSVDASTFGFNDPEVKDLCTGDIITPQIYRTSRPATKVSNANNLGAFSVGQLDTIVRLYVFQSVGQASADSMFCRQPVWLKDSLNIKTNCLPDDSITTLLAEAEKCSLDRDSVLAQIGIPVATDECLDHDIPGVASLPNGGVLPKNFAVGDTITIMWTFHDALANADSAFCFQKVTVISDQKPIFDKCDSLNATEIEYIAKDACEITFTPADFSVPTATDACTGIAYPAVGYLKSTGKPVIGSTVEVGYDTIVWVFASPTSIATDTCEQPFVVRTDKEIDFDCSTLSVITVPTKDCDVDFVDVPIVAPVAKNPCTGADIVATTDFDTTSVLMRSSTTVITWTFTDHSGTMSDSVKRCDQTIIIKNVREIPIDCDAQIKDTTVILDEGDCTIRTNELNLKVPVVTDTCKGEDVIPDFVRESGKSLTDLWGVGTERLDWIFTIDDSISVTCPQNITIKDAKPIFDCDELKDFEITIYSAGATIGSVLDTIAPVAKDPCSATDIPGTYEIDVNGSAVKPSTYLSRGTTYHVTWTFFNEVLNGDSTQCEQNITIGGQPVPGVHCERYTAIDTVLDQACELSFAQLLIKIDTVIDEHPNGLVDDVAQIILPVMYRASDPDHKVDLNNGGTLADLGMFGVGEDVIYYDYTVQGQTETCSQPVKIRSNFSPDFDCNLGLVVAVAESGKCSVPLAAMLNELEPYPVAKEHCTNTDIVGVPSLTDGSALPESFAVGDTIWVRWTFANEDYTTESTYCDQPVTVSSTAEPVFDCSSLDTLHFTAHGECSVDLEPADITAPVAKDSCTSAEIVGVGSRADGGELDGIYNVGGTTITWTFTSPYSSAVKACPQTVWVKTDKEIDAKCGTENFPDIQVAVEDGTCTVPADSVLKHITEHTALNPCDESVSIVAVASRSDKKALDDAYPVGPTTITWTFTDTTNTLVTPVATCTQNVTVGDNNKPLVDCETTFPSATLYLDEANCTVDLAAIPVNLNEMPFNTCSNEYAVLDTTRASGAAMTDPYKVGNETITWTFTFPSTGQTVVCEQEITVKDTIAPDFDCSTLADTIHVALSSSGNSVTFEEVVNAGFTIPVVTDQCTEVATIVTREDGKDYADTYELGNTKVIFTFADIYGNKTVCSQIIKVEDMVPPVIDCPVLTDNSFACADAIPAPYASFEEFKAAGGSISDESKIDLSTFRAETKVEGDECSSIFVRDYIFTTIRGVDVHCAVPQTMYVKDSLAPEYIGIPAAGVTINTSCDDPKDDPLYVTVLDNCDPAPVVSYTRVSTRGNDPSQCDYYTYDVIYTYTTNDRCGNEATPAVYTIHVKDTVAPIVHEPSDWKDDAHATYLKNCLFGVPDLTGLIPSDSVFQNCGDNQYLKYWQEPAAGDTIFETTVVKLHIEDVCGNDTVLEKTVIVQKRQEIVTLLPKSPFICGDDAAWKNPSLSKSDLSSPSLIEAQGYVYNLDFDGTYIPLQTTFFWDFFRDSVSEASLIYSNNPYSYAGKFNFKETSLDRYKLTLLTRRSQSGTYCYIATDTVTGCSDTATIYVNVNERPRLNFDSSVWNICDGDSLTLNGDFGTANPVCIDDMGSAILEQGWMVDDSVYRPQTPLYYADGASRTAIYYATNECGTTTTLNTLYTDCGAGAPVSHADSLNTFGSEANVALAAIDSLYLHDSVDVEVFTHYDPLQVLLTTDPQDKARIWIGDQAELDATMPYDEPEVYRWMKVVNAFDAEHNAVYDKYGAIISGGSNENDDEEISSQIDVKDTLQGLFENSLVITPADSASYYVVVGNGVCPSVASNLVSVDVLTKLPTAITPYTRDGLNDDFVRGHHVIIFNRYGQQVFEGNDGWDGTYRGLLADPGVYFYSVDMAGGVVLKGSVEVVKIE